MKIAAYNISSGGFTTYHPTSTSPERLKLLIQSVKQINPDFIGLADTFRWKELFTSDSLCQLFGYPYSYHINMEDTRVDPKIGLAVLTRLPGARFHPLRLYNRSCIRTEVQIKSKTWQIFTLYLDDAAQFTRLKQIRVLLKTIRPRTPTIILGDFNSLSSAAVPLLKTGFARFLKTHPGFKNRSDYHTYWLQAKYRQLLQPQVISEIESHGFVRAQGKDSPSPTAYTPLSLLGQPRAFYQFDHIFHSKNLKSKNFKVYTGKLFQEASDHYPISAHITPCLKRF